MIIKRKKISNKFLENFNKKEIQIGIKVTNDENEKVKLFNVGEVILPSPHFGATCRKNANGYSYADKSQPKENRYVCTVWTYPFGNTNASQVPVDQYRMCYPKILVQPTEIGITLYEDEDKNKYLLAVLEENNRENHLLTAINIFIEIFGECSIYDNIKNLNNQKMKRCNWELLPPGTKAIDFLNEEIQRKSTKKVNLYDEDRLDYIQSFKVEETYAGINGFLGYIAFLIDNYCVLESAVYGNATYIIPRNNWKVLSQMTKKQLTDENLVVKKIIHTANWRNEFNIFIKKIVSN